MSELREVAAGQLGVVYHLAYPGSLRTLCGKLVSHPFNTKRNPITPLCLKCEAISERASTQENEA